MLRNWKHISSTIHMKLCKNNHYMGTTCTCCLKISMIKLTLWFLYHFQFLKKPNFLYSDFRQKYLVDLIDIHSSDKWLKRNQRNNKYLTKTAKFRIIESLIKCYRILNPNKVDIWNPCQVWQVVASITTLKKCYNLPLCDQIVPQIKASIRNSFMVAFFSVLSCITHKRHSKI